MKLKQIKNNVTLVEFNRRNGHNPTGEDDSYGVQVLFSYETPVAGRTGYGEYVRTSKKYSPTTTKHINQWLDDVGVKDCYPWGESVVNQTEIDKLADR